MTDPREEEFRHHEAAQLAKGRCPYTDEVLHREGRAGPSAASCDWCDCFGYDPELVKVHPRPLHVVRWKVVRRTCKCGRKYAGDKHTTMCHQCFMEAFPLPSLNDYPF